MKVHHNSQGDPRSLSVGSRVHSGQADPDRGCLDGMEHPNQVVLGEPEETGALHLGGTGWCGLCLVAELPESTGVSSVFIYHKCSRL